MTPKKRVKELEKAIRAHREQVQAYGMTGARMDHALWAVLDTKERA